MPRPRAAPTSTPLPILMSSPVKERSLSRSSLTRHDLDTLLVAIGGGGLISGIAIAAKAAEARHSHYRGRAGGRPDLPRQPRGRPARRTHAAWRPRR